MIENQGVCRDGATTLIGSRKPHVLFLQSDGARHPEFRQALETSDLPWSASFVDTESSAFAALASDRPELFVCDFVGAGTDKRFQLLERAAKEHPRTLRVVLSDQLEDRAAVRALAVSHEFLRLPCEPRELFDELERARCLREALSDPTLREVAPPGTELPVIPEIYYQLLQLLAQPDTSWREVGTLLEPDMALSALVLRLVNSPFYGLTRTVGSIQHAVSFVGTALLKSLVLSAEVLRWFDDLPCPPGFDPRVLQKQALLTSRLTRQILPKGHFTEDASTAAMMLDIGQLVLAASGALGFHQSLKEVEEGRSLLEVEQERAGLTHAVVGAYLLESWGLPYTVIEAVAFHHDPARSASSEFGLVTALHIADGLVRDRLAGAPQKRDPDDFSVDTAYLESIGVLRHLPDWWDLAYHEIDPAGASQD